jgi:hypothetical protein
MSVPEILDDKSLSFDTHSKESNNTSTTMAPNIKIEIAREADLPELMSIVSPAFQNVPAEVLMFGAPSRQT